MTTTLIPPKSDDVFLLDGATGTELDRRGVDINLPLWSAHAIRDAPYVLKDVHLAYLEAGAGAITANTFRTHGRSLAKAGAGDLAEALTHEAVKIALAARDEFNSNALVLGSVAPLEDCYSPDLAPDVATCLREHREIIGHLVDASVDLVLLETMCSAHECRAAIKMANELAPRSWAISFCLLSSGSAGVLLDGTNLAELVPDLEGARFVGVNCVAASELEHQVRYLRGLLPSEIAIAAYGNVGYADEHGGWVSTDAIEPDRYASHSMDWVDSGASIVGGCCGTMPETIKAIRQRLQE